jgi:hypothetical protein
MNIEIKILIFFSLRKENAKEYSDLVTLDRYLVNVIKETEYLGLLLSKKIEEMEDNKFLIKNDKKKYAITQKGLEYLSKNS